MRKFLYVSMVMIVLGFVGEKAFAHKEMPGVPVEPEAQLDEVLGKNVCIVDNFGDQYNLIIDNGTISGTVDTPDCGHYSNLTGSYSGTSFTFHTGEPDAWWLRCRGYRVDGTVDIKTKTASGRYVTDGGFGSGPITFAICN